MCKEITQTQEHVIWGLQYRSLSNQEERKIGNIVKLDQLRSNHHHTLHTKTIEILLFNCLWHQGIMVSVHPWRKNHQLKARIWILWRDDGCRPIQDRIKSDACIDSKKQFTIYTKQEAEKYKLYYKLKGMIDHPSYCEYKEMVCNKILPNWPITTNNIINTEIYIFTRLNICKGKESKTQPKQGGNGIISSHNQIFLQVTNICDTYIIFYVYQWKCINDNVSTETQVFTSKHI